jgi:hypothetical protein
LDQRKSVWIACSISFGWYEEEGKQKWLEMQYFVVVAVLFSAGLVLASIE